jgi:hypothetical protein
MLEVKDAAGYVWYFNHLISFVILSVIGFWASKQSLTGHPDKMLHTVASGTLTFIFLTLFSFIHVSWWIAPIVVFLVGVGKEVYDYFHPQKHTCDIKDLFADCMGIIAVTSVYIFSFLMYKEM